MKLFRNILNTVKPHFEKGGKLEKMYPAYDAFETFLFVPDHTTHSGSHIRDAIDLKRTMITVLLALMPALFFGMWNIGQLHFSAIGAEFTLMSAFTFGAFKMLPLIIVSYAVGLGRGETLRLVVIPQALRIIIPPLTSQYLNLTKNSSLAVAIAYPELVSIFAGTALNQVGQEIEIIFMMAMVYLTFSLLTSLFMNWFNSRIKLVER